MPTELDKELHKDLEHRMEVERAIRDDRQHWWVYSPESLPDSRPGFGREYLQAGDGFTFSVEAGQWKRLGMETPSGFSSFFQTVRFSDFQDRRGTIVTVTAEDAAAVIRERYADRGVVVLPEHVYRDEQKRAEAERIAKERNLEFRKRLIAQYEAQLEQHRQLGLKNPPMSRYLEESYAMLGMVNPCSFEARLAERNPGSASAQAIAKALANALEPLIRLVAKLEGGSVPNGNGNAATLEISESASRDADDGREIRFDVA